ncbi:MAG: hypothetical protein GW903_00840 [Alphaproteobacteria bacterium]|nr:hypothetical protein [Alphaproteobacteria bacterium]NCT06385.1 hypothetical protein [Alphaproteobacteria bacterium]
MSLDEPRINHNSNSDFDTIARGLLVVKAEKAFEVVRSSSDSDIRGLSFDQRFQLIHSIQKGILADAPDPSPQHPHEPIDENQFKPEMEAIDRVSRSLKLSDFYRNFMVNVSRQAAYELIESTRNTRAILEWKPINTGFSAQSNPEAQDSENFYFLREFHWLFIEFLHQNMQTIGASLDFLYAVVPATIEPVHLKPALLSDGRRSTIVHGIAKTDITSLPNGYKIYANTHPDSMLDTAPNAAELIGHESAHIAEGIFGFTFNHHAGFVHEEFTKDAALIESMHRNKGYISPRLYSAYEKQSVETVAQLTGLVAREVVTNFIERQKSKPRLSLL